MDFKDLEKKLENLIEKVNDLKDLSERSKSERKDITTMSLHKKIEDGVLDNIHNANKSQLINFLKNYRFQYYTEYNDKELLKNEVNRRLRDNKLKQLLDD